MKSEKNYSLNKEELKKKRKEFSKTNDGILLNRLLLIGILGILFSIILFISQNRTDFIIAIILLIFSIIFILASFILKKNKFNKFLSIK